MYYYHAVRNIFNVKIKNAFQQYVFVMEILIVNQEKMKLIVGVVVFLQFPNRIFDVPPGVY